MFKVDLHVHTILGGDSGIEPEELVPSARRAGLDAICVTEHHSFYLSEPFDEISQRSGFLIFRGMEYHAQEGHLLVFGVPVSPSNLPRGLPAQWAIDWIQQRGGVAIPAHPYQKGLLGSHLGDRVLSLHGLFALETLNGSSTDQENRDAQRAARILGVKGTGGSDAHGPSLIGRAYTVFPRPLESLEDLVQCLRNGEYMPQGNWTQGGSP
jgi:hypothetical protein